MIIVAIGGATTSAMMSLYFADASQTCDGATPQQVQTNFARSAITLGAPVDPADNALNREVISQNDAAIAIAIDRSVDFSQGAQYDHGDEYSEEAELAEENPALADLAGTF